MGNQRDSLGDRMKRYEYVSRNYLTRRVPVIIRIDGKAFHTFTKGMRKPFDRVLMSAMQETMRFLCANIQGCVFGYTQSDEITLVLTDYASIRTDAWFGYNVQKMCSIAASMATLAFNKAFAEQTEKEDSGIDLSVYRRKFQTAMFDARAFTVPLDEVCNCLIWRQQDATRNSIEAVGQANFSQRELHGKNCNKIQDMLWKERNMQKATFSLLSSKEKAGRDCPALLLLKQIVRQFQLEAHQNFSVAFYRAAAIRRHKDIRVTKLWVRGY